MKKMTIPLLIMGFLVFSSAIIPAKKGYKYKPAEGKLSVTFPAAYNVSEVFGESSKTVKAECRSGELNFLVSYTIHELPLEDYEGLAEVSLESFNDQLSGEITERSPWDIKGSKGIKSTIHMESDDVRVQYWVVLKGQIQYQVVAVAATESWNSSTIDSFFQSFKLK